jgi:hypothetical protein
VEEGRRKKGNRYGYSVWEWGWMNYEWMNYEAQNLKEALEA